MDGQRSFHCASRSARFCFHWTIRSSSILCLIEASTRNKAASTAPRITGTSSLVSGFARRTFMSVISSSKSPNASRTVVGKNGRLPSRKSKKSICMATNCSNASWVGGKKSGCGYASTKALLSLFAFVHTPCIISNSASNCARKTMEPCENRERTSSVMAVSSFKSSFWARFLAFSSKYLGNQKRHSKIATTSASAFKPIAISSMMNFQPNVEATQGCKPLSPPSCSARVSFWVASSKELQSQVGSFAKDLEGNCVG